jgi:hypothetical protein
MSLHRQRVLEMLGLFGCYLLCLIELAERSLKKKLDSEVVYGEMLSRGFMDTECFLFRPDLIISSLTGKRYVVRKESASYVVKENELEVLRYELKGPMKTLAHFVLSDYDPYGESQTRTRGVLVSKRIFTLVG